MAHGGDHEHGEHGHGTHEHGHAHHGHHEGGHGHGHGHGHQGGHEEGGHGLGLGHEHMPKRADLARGAGLGKTLFLDAPSGLAGDMVIAALLDLGVPVSVIRDGVNALGLEGFHLHFGRRVRSGVVATAFDVHVDAAQPERTYREVRALVEGAALEDAVKARALRTFARLAEAEAKVHHSPIDDVHFHEVGAIDALVDVVGSAAALEYLGADLVVSPLPMGRGFVRARHGVLPLPAPATVECLRGLPTYDGGLDFEFVTPTGAAIVAAHAKGASRWPNIVPEVIGWGAGTKDLSDRPNVLRAVLGASPASASSTASLGEHSEATHVVLETNVDDATGELVANAIDVLLREGALDAWAAPITMKKGRPAFTVAVLATRANAAMLAGVLLRETTSIGVRSYPVSRLERPRRMVDVSTRFGTIPVKIAEGPFGPPQMKPELEACKTAAREHGVPLREVMAEALVAARTVNTSV